MTSLSDRTCTMFAEGSGLNPFDLPKESEELSSESSSSDELEESSTEPEIDDEENARRPKEPRRDSAESVTPRSRPEEVIRGSKHSKVTGRTEKTLMSQMAEISTTLKEVVGRLDKVEESLASSVSRTATKRKVRTIPSEVRVSIDY